MTGGLGDRRLGGVPRPGGNGLLRAALAVVVGAALLAFALRSVDFTKVGLLIASAAILPLVLATVAYAAGFVLRAVRFWAMLQATSGRPIVVGRTITPFIASFGISDLLPLRAGDAFRVAWFSRQFGLPVGVVLGTMIVERLFDLVSVVAFGALALWFVDLTASPLLESTFRLVVALVASAGLALLFAPALVSSLPRKLTSPSRLAVAVSVLLGWLHDAAAAVAGLGSGRRLVLFMTLSLGCWALEAMVFFGAWFSLGGAASAIVAPLLAFVFSTLGMAIPGLPGHFGPFEYFGLQAFHLLGVDASLAAAVVFVAHLLLWLPIALFGVGWLMTAALRSRAGVATELRGAEHRPVS